MEVYSEKNFYSIEEISILYNSERLIDMLLNDKSLQIRYETIKVKKGEHLILASTKSEFVYFTNKGLLAMKKENYIFDFISVGDFIGLYELFIEETSILNVLGIKESEVLRFKKKDVIFKMLSYQEGFFYYLYHMNRMLGKTINKQTMLVMSAEKRVIVALIQILERFGKANKEGFLLPKEFTNKLISEYSKCHLTTMPYIFKNLQNYGAILSACKPYVYDLEKLKQLENNLVAIIKKGVCT